MNLSDESLETMKIGVTCAVFAILFAALVPLFFVARGWYMEAENKLSETGHMKTLSDSYIMEQKGEVTGNDIVEFILKNDSLYDYYITVNGSTYPITKKKAESLLLSGNDTCIWSEDYLLDTVFLNHSIYDTYSVVPVRNNDETISYKFYQK